MFGGPCHLLSLVSPTPLKVIIIVEREGVELVALLQNDVSQNVRIIYPTLILNHWSVERSLHRVWKGSEESGIPLCVDRLNHDDFWSSFQCDWVLHGSLVILSDPINKGSPDLIVLYQLHLVNEGNIDQLPLLNHLELEQLMDLRVNHSCLLLPLRT